MKIAFVSLMRASPWGGSEELWYGVAKHALAKGHTVITLTQKWDKLPEKIKEIRQLGADTKFYDVARYNIIERIAAKMNIKQTSSDFVPELDADIYVLSNGSTWDFLYNYQLAKRVLGSEKPYILISQHNFENGHIVKENQRDYAIAVIKKAKKVFFVSEQNMRSAERQLGSFMEGAQVVSNPVNIKEISIKPFPVSQKLLMACVARLDCDFKGQDVLLQVLGSERWLNRDFSLKLYGSGPHLQHLHHLIRMYGLQDKVSIVGHAKNIDYIWENNQVLVLPSLSEGTPLVLVEAMLSGRAVVTTDVGDNGRFVRNNETGYLAATASEKSFAVSLEDLWINKKSLKDMGEVAFMHASKLVDLNPELYLLHFIEN